MIALDALHAAPPVLTLHAPALLVVAPLIAACAAALAPSGRIGWMISVTGSVFAAWMALALVGETARHGLVTYTFGGFAPPLGIGFHIDGLGAMMALLISCAGAIASIYSGHALAAEVRAEKHTLVQAGFLLCQSGLLGLVSTGDAFNAFVFLEVSSIGAYALVAIGESRDRRALPAAFNYLIMGTIGATFYLIGLGFLYAATGTLNMADMAARLATLSDSTVVQAGFAFIVVGLGIKAAMFPLHGWLPGAYAYAPSLVSIFLAATATKASLYLLARFVFDVFPHDAAFGQAFIHWVLAPLGATAAIVCSLQAIFEKEVRRILAFSSVAQVGFILLGLSVGAASGFSGAMLYLLAHALLKMTLFMAIGGLALSLRFRTLEDIAGIARDAPWSATALAIGAASLAGAPLTVGFLAKWRLIEDALQAGQVWIVVVLAVASLLTLLYVGRMIEAVFFRASPAGAQRAKEAPVGALVPLFVIAGLCIWFGVDASLPKQLASSASHALMGAP